LATGSRVSSLPSEISSLSLFSLHLKIGLCSMISADELAFLRPTWEICPGFLTAAEAGHHSREEQKERSRGIRQGTRVRRTTHWPDPALLWLRLRSPKWHPETPRASAKPTSWILPTRAVRWNLQSQSHVTTDGQSVLVSSPFWNS
jgi:hypothetical protein